MKREFEREDDFQERRENIKDLSDEELKERFWQLAGKIVDPMIELARTHTSPSIERAVLLRMGFSSLEAKPIVEKALDHGLISKGVGHVIYRVAKDKDLTIRQAGLELMDGKHWDYALSIFKGGEK